MTKRLTPEPWSVRDPDSYCIAHRFVANIGAYIACSSAEGLIMDGFAPLSLPLQNIIYGMLTLHVVLQRKPTTDEKLILCKNWLKENPISLGLPSMKLLLHLLGVLLHKSWSGYDKARIVVWVNFLDISRQQLGLHHPLSRVLELLNPKLESDLLSSLPFHHLLELSVDAVPDIQAVNETADIHDRIFSFIHDLLYRQACFNEQLSVLRWRLEETAKRDGEKSYSTNSAKYALASEYWIRNKEEEAQKLLEQVRYTFVPVHSLKNELQRVLATFGLGLIARSRHEMDQALYLFEDSMRWLKPT